MKNSAKILATLATGVAVGGALGILFAPDKGTSTRKMISMNGKKLMKTIKGKFGKAGLEIAKEKLEKQLQKANTKMHEFSDNEKQTV